MPQRVRSFKNSLPLNGAGGLGCQVKQDPVDALNLLRDALGDVLEQVKGDVLHRGGHGVHRVYRPQDDRVLHGPGMAPHAHRPEVGDHGKVLPHLARKACLVNVGDSRAYLLREQGVTRITEDHSVVQLMVRRGEITEEEAKDHPYRNIITRALGTDETVESDGYRTTLAAGEYLLLCTDGLTITVTDQEMLFEILHGGDEESCLSRLLAIAKEHGAPDNVTAVLMRQTEGGE